MQNNLVDLHCHILPGMDDGPQTMGESLEMVQDAVREGIRTIVATPHFIVGEIEYDLDFIKEQVKLLQTKIHEKGLECKILTGSEVYICPELVQVLEKGKLVTINETSYVLVEFPAMEVAEYSIEIVRDLILRGYRPIIAHPERNETLSNHVEVMQRLVDMGCYFQVNSSSIVGKHGSRTQKFAIEMVKKGLVNFISSDGHSMNRRPIRLAEAFATLDRLTRLDISSYLINNGRCAIEGREIRSIDIERISKSRGVLERLREIFGK